MGKYHTVYKTFQRFWENLGNFSLQIFMVRFVAIFFLCLGFQLRVGLSTANQPDLCHYRRHRGHLYASDWRGCWDFCSLWPSLISHLPLKVFSSSPLPKEQSKQWPKILHGECISHVPFFRLWFLSLALEGSLLGSHSPDLLHLISYQKVLLRNQDKLHQVIWKISVHLASIAR